MFFWTERDRRDPVTKVKELLADDKRQIENKIAVAIKDFFTWQFNPLNERIAGNYWYDTPKKIEQNAIDNKLKQFFEDKVGLMIEEQVKRELDKYIKGESFIDAIVKRIKDKQLGGV